MQHSLMVVVVLAACGGESNNVQPDAAGDPDAPAAIDGGGGVPVVDDDLVFTRADTTVVEFPADAEFFVSCGPFDGDTDPAMAIRIFHFSESGDLRGWYLKAVIADVPIGTPITIPEGAQHFEFFLNDPPNELSSGDDDSTGGTFTFQAIDCAGSVAFAVDADLGSEEGGPNVRATGTFSSTVANNEPGRLPQPRVSD